MDDIILTSNEKLASKAQILEWINDVLSISIPTLEYLGTGAIYC